MAELDIRDSIPDHIRRYITPNLESYRHTLGSPRPEPTDFDASKLSDMKDIDFLLLLQEDQTGYLAEITSRGFEDLQANVILPGEVNVISPDGVDLDVGDRIMDPYLFKIKGVDYTGQKPPILKGTAQKFHMHDGVASGLEFKLEVHFNEIPTFKEDLGYQPLG